MFGELNPCGGGDAIPLLKSKLLVGRRSSCDISLRFPNVSSHHCELELVNGYWFVRDLGSRNGIKVNGMGCDSKWLMPGDVLSVVRHRYEVAYAPQGDAPPPEEEDPFAQGLLEKAGLTRRQTEQMERVSEANEDEDRPARHEIESVSDIGLDGNELAKKWAKNAADGRP